MTIEQIKQQLINDGLNPDDYLILVTQNGYSVWKKEFAPDFMRASEQAVEPEKQRNEEQDYYLLDSDFRLSLIELGV